MSRLSKWLRQSTRSYCKYAIELGRRCCRSALVRHFLRDARRFRGATGFNTDARAVIESVKRPGQKPPDRIFPRVDRKNPFNRKQHRFDTRSRFLPCLVEARISGYVWHGNRHTILLLAGNGRGVDQGDSGGGRAQNNHYGCTL